jgi:hypothetical protein
MTYVGDVTSQILNAILYGLLKDTVGSDIFKVGQDVGSMLEDLEIHSTMEFKQEPDKTGHLPEQFNEEVWHTVRYKWSLGVDCLPGTDCGWQQFSLYQVGQEVVEANFEAQVDDLYYLTIYPHPLNLKYGALVNYIIEKQVLPAIAGNGTDGYPKVDSYEELLGALLAGKDCLKMMDCCDQFAEEVTSQAGGMTESLVSGACSALIQMGSDYLRNYLLSLDTSTGDAFVIGTKSECLMIDSDEDQDIDTLGLLTAPCLWDVQLDLGGTVYHVDATFTGERQ